MPSFRSIRTRLAVWHTAVLAVGLILFSVAVWLSVQHLLMHELRESLRGESRGLQTYIELEARDAGVDLKVEMDEYARSLPAETVVAVFDSRGKAVFSNDPDLHDLERGDRPTPFRSRGRPYLGLRGEVTVRQGTLTTYIGLPMVPALHTLHLLATALAVLVPGFILLGWFGGFWLSRRAFEPVDAITARARETGLRNLSDRLPDPGGSDEISRLTQAWNEMLERLDGAVSELQRFTADASHELRTPVAIVRLAAENALSRARSEEDYRLALRSIQAQSEAMTSLLSDLLFLARAEGGQPEATVRVRVDIGPLVNEVVAQVADLAAAKSVRLSIGLAERNRVGVTDGDALKRLLLILLENAIKYTPQSGMVQVAWSSDEGNVNISVVDTGIGIAPEYRELIFRRFFRIDPSRNRATGGFGLGLAIAANIAKENSATITVGPNPVGGSTFTVLWPVEE